MPNPANVPGGKPELYDVWLTPRGKGPGRGGASGVKELFVEIENWWPAR